MRGAELRRVAGVAGLAALIAAGAHVQIPFVPVPITLQTFFVLLAGLFVYHYRCYACIRRLRGVGETQDSKWLRWFNEVPVVFLLGIILLAVVKP